MVKFSFIRLVPSQNPYIYWYSVVDYSTIWIKWHRVEYRYIRGTLLGYRVYVLEAEYRHGSQPYKREITINDPDQFDFNISGLPPATRFRIWVAAFTSIGEGTQRHEKWIKTSKVVRITSAHVPMISHNVIKEVKP